MSCLLKNGLMWCCAAIAICSAGAAAQKTDAQGIEKIAAYAGTWAVDIQHVETPYSKAGHDHNTLRNDCWRSGPYFACNQYVDGDSKALLVFTCDAKADRYTSYPVPEDGNEAGKDALLIRGNTWTYPWETKDGGKTTSFRVVNTWVKPDEIEFRQEFSVDNVKWSEMAHGLEKRTAAGKTQENGTE
jgi:hypothetical protein